MRIARHSHGPHPERRIQLNLGQNRDATEYANTVDALYKATLGGHLDLITCRGGGDQSAAAVARRVAQKEIEQFVEGSDTADLKAAERLLATLG